MMENGLARRLAAFGAALLLVAAPGCASLRADEAPADAASPAPPMTQARMELLFAEEVDAIAGPPGAIQTRVDGINVYLISLEETDRMRIIAPIAVTQHLNRRVYEILLTANFDSTKEARYAISDGVVYAVFMHPISSLSPELLRSALQQVLSLVKTFGSTFSAGRGAFAAEPPSQRPAEEPESPE
jgi:hypothetical protein